VVATSVSRSRACCSLLGSQIKECNKAGENCKSLWGTLEAVSDRGVSLAYDESKNYKVEVLDRMFSKNVYGDILEYIDNLYPGRGILNVFSYDWRRSGADNAKGLSKFACDIQANHPGRPLFFIAHSMGGLY
jgi:Lecithin:cholesterol acyltransferase